MLCNWRKCGPGSRRNTGFRLTSWMASSSVCTPPLTGAPTTTTGGLLRGPARPSGLSTPGRQSNNSFVLNMSTKYKRGTIGHTVEQLVKRHGQSTMGIFILESALRDACGVRSGSIVNLDGKFIHETPGYLARRDEENRIMEEIRARNQKDLMERGLLCNALK